MRKFFLIFSLLFVVISSNAQRVKKVVLQGYWWDYYNNNFPQRWSDYLTELAPRLKAAGIDAVWVPPAYKNTSTSYVGYSPFDHYDLGDKYQKGGPDSITVRTRMGNKNELLRMVAVMHANGLDVIEDVVMNHVNDAGTNNGAGGRDPQSPFSIANANGYKNFRYVSYSTPLLDESQNDYWTRNGRWPKNYTNFYPNAANNCTTGDICSAFFGPDVAYDLKAVGQSSNIPRTGTATIGTIRRNYINPVQADNYMLNNSRDWLVWLKKQTGFDGWRFDAVKHFPIYAQQDVIYNTKYGLPSFAAGGEDMFCVGEWIGGKADLDNYVNAVRSSTEEHTGAFDFSLRGYGPTGGLYSMVLGQGGYNMQNIPGEQQNKRFFDYGAKRVYRTVPFVNNHDNFRPFLNSQGNYSKSLGDATGWNTAQELGGNGQHIDPREPRLFSAYATAFAVDGNPCVYFEDLFDIGTTGKRFTHLPTNTADLPIRQDIVNIIQAHQTLRFKDGDYNVPTALTGTQAPFYAKGSADNHLVIERSNRAIIGITDKYSTVADNSADEEVWVSVSGAWRNLDLIDYSGAHGLTTTRVYSDGRVLIKTAPVSHNIPGALGHGYSIWAPLPPPEVYTINTVQDLYNYLANFAQPGRNPQTVQEWEMADDLGDSHARSLRQGGRLPDNSSADRLVGSIFAAAGSPVTILLYPEVSGRSQTITLSNSANTVLSTISGTSSNTAPLTLNFTPTNDGWINIRVRNTLATVAGQRVWVNVRYTAPAVVNTRSSAARLARPAVISEGANTPLLEETTVYPNPTQGPVRISMKGLASFSQVSAIVTNSKGAVVGRFNGAKNYVESAISNMVKDQPSGMFIINLTAGSSSANVKLIKY